MGFRGQAWTPKEFKTVDGFQLGAWAGTQRKYYKNGKLSAERIARLEALPGWVWKAAN